VAGGPFGSGLIERAKIPLLFSTSRFLNMDSVLLTSENKNSNVELALGTHNTRTKLCIASGRGWYIQKRVCPSSFDHAPSMVRSWTVRGGEQRLFDWFSFFLIF
jgi:hypothetical protein